jgi:hypothetical protein
MRSILESYGYLMPPEYRAYNEAMERTRNNSFFEKLKADMKKEIIAELKPFLE